MALLILRIEFSPQGAEPRRGASIVRPIIRLYPTPFAAIIAASPCSSPTLPNGFKSLDTSAVSLRLPW